MPAGIVLTPFGGILPYVFIVVVNTGSISGFSGDYLVGTPSPIRSLLQRNY